MAPQFSQLLQALLARDEVADAATTLGERGIAVMPLKGVLLAAWIDRAPGERSMLDADLLVPEARYDEACAHLESRGDRPLFRGRSGIEASFRSSRGVVLDVHRRLFAPGRFAMPTDAVFARATIDRALFGVAIHRMHELDLFAHLVGKLVTDRADERDVRRIADLERAPAALRLDPDLTAQHLVACGMARAARYSLGICASRGDRFASATLARLPRDRTGDVLALGARALLRRARPRAPAGALPSHLLGPSLRASIVSLAHGLRSHLR